MVGKVIEDDGLGLSAILQYKLQKTVSFPSGGLNMCAATEDIFCIPINTCGFEQYCYHIGQSKCDDFYQRGAAVLILFIRVAASFQKKRSQGFRVITSLIDMCKDVRPFSSVAFGSVPC